ncbi:flagellar protein export ATPase FliI [Bacillota bacterium Meth-B3]
MTLARCRRVVKNSQPIRHCGKIDKVVGMVIESTGPTVDIGTMCRVYDARNSGYSYAETVGFKGDRVLLMPFGDLAGVVKGSVVESTGDVLRVPVGNGLIGRVIDGFGEPIDGAGPIDFDRRYPVLNIPSNPFDRPRIDERIGIGVRPIDALLTCGKGQRMGIFSGSGVGKSTLLGMMVRGVTADVNVVALVGERGREVRDFIEKDLQAEGMARSVLVVATSDQSAMMRLKCALTATTIAEYFRDQGKDVLLVMDSLTRFAMAQREIGLAVGEPPVARGYTPSLYALMPKLLERSGKFAQGSITGFYTVLVEGDDTNEPISDTVRGILDGHIVLSRAIAMRNQYPAIDVLASISRLMSEIVPPEHQALASRMRQVMSAYNENADLISIGAYKTGSSAKIDHAIANIDRINAFLAQGVDERVTFEETLAQMQAVIQQ